MAKIVVCECDRCKRVFHKWNYKKGDSMDNADYCPPCEARRWLQ